MLPLLSLFLLQSINRDSAFYERETKRMGMSISSQVYKSVLLRQNVICCFFSPSHFHCMVYWIHIRWSL